MIELLIYSAYALAVVFGVVAVAYVCAVFGCIAYAFVDAVASLYKSACTVFEKVRGRVH